MPQEAAAEPAAVAGSPMPPPQGKAQDLEPQTTAAPPPAAAPPPKETPELAAPTALEPAAPPALEPAAPPAPEPAPKPAGQPAAAPEAPEAATPATTSTGAAAAAPGRDEDTAPRPAPAAEQATPQAATNSAQDVLLKLTQMSAANGDHAREDPNAPASAAAEIFPGHAAPQATAPSAPAALPNGPRSQPTISSSPAPLAGPTAASGAPVAQAPWEQQAPPLAQAQPAVQTQPLAQANPLAQAPQGQQAQPVGQALPVAQAQPGVGPTTPGETLNLLGDVCSMATTGSSNADRPEAAATGGPARAQESVAGMLKMLAGPPAVSHAHQRAQRPSMVPGHATAASVNSAAYHANADALAAYLRSLKAPPVPGAPGQGMHARGVAYPGAAQTHSGSLAARTNDIEVVRQLKARAEASVRGFDDLIALASKRGIDASGYRVGTTHGINAGNFAALNRVHPGLAAAAGIPSRNPRVDDFRAGAHAQQQDLPTTKAKSQAQRDVKPTAASLAAKKSAASAASAGHPKNHLAKILTSANAAAKKAKKERAPKKPARPPRKRIAIVKDSWRRPRCSEPGCDRVDRGTGLCSRHGGGVRCDVKACKKLARVGFKCFEHLPADARRHCFARKEWEQNPDGPASAVGKATAASSASASGAGSSPAPPSTATSAARQNSKQPKPASQKRKHDDDGSETGEESAQPMSYFAPLASREAAKSEDRERTATGRALSISFSDLLARPRSSAPFKRPRPSDLVQKPAKAARAPKSATVPAPTTALAAASQPAGAPSGAAPPAGALPAAAPAGGALPATAPSAADPTPPVAGAAAPAIEPGQAAIAREAGTENKSRPGNETQPSHEAAPKALVQPENLEGREIFGVGEGGCDVSCKRRDVSGLGMAYKRVIGKGFQMGMDAGRAEVPEDDPSTDEDLQILPVGWTKHQTSAKAKKKFLAPTGLKFNSLAEVLRRIVPATIGYKHVMPVQDFFWMFRDLVGAADQRAWAEYIRSDDRRHKLACRITDYKQLKKSLGLNACRIKMTTTTYIVVALPVYISYSHKDQCAQFHFESKLTTFDKLPRELLKLLPVSTGIPTDTPSSRPAKKQKR